MSSEVVAVGFRANQLESTSSITRQMCGSTQRPSAMIRRRIELPSACERDKLVGVRDNRDVHPVASGSDLAGNRLPDMIRKSPPGRSRLDNQPIFSAPVSPADCKDSDVSNKIAQGSK